MASESSKSRRRSPRVLLVEDDGALRKMVASYLCECGYSVDEAQNGLEALERLRQSPPDVTLLDLNMPQMDGATFMDNCRRDPRWACVPVVVLSGSTADEDRATRIGARAYLMKPIDLDVLHAVLERVAAT